MELITYFVASPLRVLATDAAATLLSEITVMIRISGTDSFASQCDFDTPRINKKEGLLAEGGL